MSQLEVNKILPQSGTTLTLGESGDTITIPSGATLNASNATLTLPDGTVTNAKVNASAAIAYSKLNLATSIVNADISTTAAIATTKLGAGAVLQVVSNVYSTATTVSTSTYTDTGLSLSITPSSASNKILVLISQSIFLIRDGDRQTVKLRLVKDSTSIHTMDNALQFIGGQNNLNEIRSASLVSVVYLDSPSTTSSITYKTQGAVVETSSGGSVIFQVSSTPSTITLLEIAG
jgi:hypothetical protein